MNCYLDEKLLAELCLNGDIIIRYNTPLTMLKDPHEPLVFTPDNILEMQYLMGSPLSESTLTDTKMHVVDSASGCT